MPRPAPRPGGGAIPGRPAPMPRRTNPLAEEIRKRKEMEAKRAASAGGAAPAPQARRARPARRPGGVSMPVVIGVALALVIGTVVILWKFLGVF